MKHGMTLLEVLLALALLASLVVATTSWTTMAATFGTRLDSALDHEASAEAFLRLVHDSIAAGDIEHDDDADEQPRIFIDEAEGALVVHTRSEGEECSFRFTHDSQRNELALNEEGLLDDVVAATWLINEEQHVLTIEIVIGDRTFERRYVLP